MVSVKLTPGNHTIEWSLDGYETISAVINISTGGLLTCISTVTDTCAELVSIIGSTITGVLKSSTPDNFNDWILSKGGYDAIEGNLLLMGEFVEIYFGITIVGFTPTLGEMGLFIEHYFGIA